VKRILNNALLAVVSLCAVLLASEGVLRVTHLFGARVSWTEPDTLIGWRFTPGREYWYRKENDHAITGRINSAGWRDRERALRKPAGEYRVAVVGDSYVEAFQVELDSTFVAIAERSLARRLDRPVEVMNFGRAGMTQSEELLVLERDVFRWDPDVVVLVFVPQNDIADVDRATTDNPLRPFFHIGPGDSLVLDTSFRETREFEAKVRANALKQRSALVSLVAERFNAWRLTRRRSRAPDAARDGLPGALSLCTAKPSPRFARNYALCKRLVEEAAARCRERGIGFVLTAVPWVYRPEAADRYRGADPTFDPHFFDDDLAAWADSTGVEYLGLQRPFERRYAETGERLHWDHWNYAGHRLAGRVLARRLALDAR
jgi:hypothetical protein